MNLPTKQKTKLQLNEYIFVDTFHLKKLGVNNNLDNSLTLLKVRFNSSTHHPPPVPNQRNVKLKKVSLLMLCILNCFTHTHTEHLFYLFEKNTYYTLKCNFLTSTLFMQQP